MLVTLNSRLNMETGLTATALFVEDKDVSRRVVEYVSFPRT